MRKGEKPERTHPKPGALREMLRSLAVPDAGLVLHLLDCERCARLARKALAPKPIGRRQRTVAASGGKERS